MSAAELATKVAYWVSAYPFCSSVTVHDVPGYCRILFTTFTTKSRASSIVTRLGLIVAELAGDRKYVIGKEPVSDQPLKMARDAIREWRIFVDVPKRTRKEQ